MQGNITSGRGERERDTTQTLRKKPPLPPSGAVGATGHLEPQNQIKGSKAPSSPAMDDFVRIPSMEKESSAREDKHAYHRDGPDKWDKKDKKSFTWGFSDKVRDREKEKEREKAQPREKDRIEDSGLELTRMIGEFDFRAIHFVAAEVWADVDIRTLHSLHTRCFWLSNAYSYLYIILQVTLPRPQLKTGLLRLKYANGHL
jgi:hypothetical protein